MRFNHKGLAENLLFSLLGFIVFLMAYESSIVVPTWLQPIGRMHPMLLHFPIVILMLAMVLEFFRFQSKYKTQEFYLCFTSNLLLYGTLFSALTVIMGMFLSLEEGYSASVLKWHKWAGLSLVFLASLIYWSRNASWYKDPAAKTGAVLTFFCLIFTGHFGAILTHGDNFILEPIVALEKTRVSLEEAVVFDHVIQPVFEKKCIGCHNPDKLKGELVLTDSTSIRKGGKTGELLVAGSPEISLLMQRIHLPLQDKKHMPPSGKIQLTPNEVTLLRLWIKNNADFNRKVAELPVSDTLRQLVSPLFDPIETGEEKYVFAAADDGTIQKLNNDYRRVAPLAIESPALAVNIYNKDVFTTSTLEELKEIKVQIVFLNLNEMPVKDLHLKTVSKFENLVKLHLNFTDISGKGLKELITLKNLKSLSLSGTKVNFRDLQEQIPSFKSLKKLALWNTLLTNSEIQQLQEANKRIEITAGYEAVWNNLLIENSSPK